MRSNPTSWGALALAALCGCGFADAPGVPKIEAHRGGAGNWPENSRTAITQAVQRAGYDGLEFDVVLTSDRVAVLSHDPWLNPELCTLADGTTPIPATPQILIKDLTLSQLQSTYKCGGLPDPEQPDAQVIADTHLTLAEFIDAVRDAGRQDMDLHFDIKYDPGTTLPLTDFFDVIVGQWLAAGMSNAWYVSSTEADFMEEARQRNIPGRSFTWPKFPVGQNTTLTGLGVELQQQLGLSDAISQAQAVGATMLNLRYEMTDRTLIEAAREQYGWPIQLWTLNSEAALAAYCRWPADTIITDYPERAPCLNED